MKKLYPKSHLLISFFLLITVLLGALFLKYQLPKISIVQKVARVIPTLTPSPTPFIFRSYTAPVIEKKPAYTIVMIGDSMTAALGPHGGGLSEYLKCLLYTSPSPRD